MHETAERMTLATASSQRTISESMRAAFRGGGAIYLCLYTTRWFLQQILDRMDRGLVAIEQKRRLVQPWTISARRFTAAENRALWNTYDWSLHGEEWTPDATWKARVVRELLVPHVPEGSTVVEIGPGGGRWSELLQRRAAKLYVVDLSERAIQLCRERFAGCSNVEFLLTDGRTVAVPETTIDAVWSYDVFVHINPLDAQSYFREFKRILKPGGRAVVHHPGRPLSGHRERPGWRSDLTDEMISEFGRENGLRLISRTQEFVNEGDFLSIFEKPHGVGSG